MSNNGDSISLFGAERHAAVSVTCSYCIGRVTHAVVRCKSICPSSGL